MPVIVAVAAVLAVLGLVGVALVAWSGGDGPSELRVLGPGAVEVPARASAVEQPEEVWSRRAGDVRAGFWVAGDRFMYAAGGGAGHRLIGLDIEDGEPAWEADVGAGAVGVGAVVDDRLLVVVSPEQGDGGRSELLSIDPDSGDETWRTELVGRGQALVWPALVGGSVVVFTSGDDATEVSGFDPSTGEEHWNERGDVIAGIDEDALYVIDNRSLLAIDAGRGDRLWSKRSADATAATRVGDLLLVLAGDRVEALGAGDGEERWTRGYGIGSLELVAGLSDDRALVIGADEVRVVSADDGAPDDDFAPRASPWLDGDVVAVPGDRLLSSTDDEVRLLHPDDGEELGRTPLRDLEDDAVIGQLSGIALTRDSAYVVGDDEVISRSYEDGLARQWTVQVEGLRNVFATDGGFVARTDDGFVSYE